MTKPITTVAAMMLYEEGRLRLQDLVSKFIPSFKTLQVDGGNGQLVAMEREITIRDLMIHTSGVYNVRDYNKTLDENIQDLVKAPLLHQPGGRWQYSQSPTVLAYVVELVTGQTFDQVLRDRIFEPLEMVDTAYFVPKEKINRFCAAYLVKLNGGWRLTDRPANGEFSKPRKLHSGSSALVSTAQDYLRFAQMLLNGGEMDCVRLLETKTVEYMMTNHVPLDLLPLKMGDEAYPGLGFGLGGAVVMDPELTQVLEPAGSFGWSGRHGTDFWIDPKHEIIGMVLTQLEPVGYYPLVEEMKEIVYQSTTKQF